MANQSLSEKFQENLLLYSQTESIEERHSIEAESLGRLWRGVCCLRPGHVWLLDAHA